MMRILLTAGMALLIAVGTASAASKHTALPKEESVVSPVVDDDDDFLAPLFVYRVDQGRKDVREVLLPQPTYGPSIPIPFCNPASPICP